MSLPMRPLHSVTKSHTLSHLLTATNPLHGTISPQQRRIFMLYSHLEPRKFHTVSMRHCEMKRAFSVHQQRQYSSQVAQGSPADLFHEIRTHNGHVPPDYVTALVHLYPTLPLDTSPESGTFTRRDFLLNLVNALDHQQELPFFRLILNIASGSQESLYMRCLLDMREDVLRLLDQARRGEKSAASENTVRDLSILEDALRALFLQECGENDLHLEQLSMLTPALVFRSIIPNERVHPFRGEGWLDIQQRIGYARRFYYFEHPLMPYSPLAFLQVALFDQVATNMPQVLQEPSTLRSESDATTAIFYSISSVEPGLKGVELGHHLIMGAVKRLQDELPNIHEYYTLSPLPGFLPWLVRYLEANHNTALSVREKERIEELYPEEGAQQTLLALVKKAIAAGSEKTATTTSPSNALTDILASPHLEEVWRPILMRFAAQYLVLEKRPGKRPSAVDPVTNFHVRNGARVGQLNWLGDKSDARVRQSFGIMVNYQYQFGEIDRRHAAYVERGQVEADPERMGQWLGEEQKIENV